MVSSETVELNCRNMDPDKDSESLLYFNTDTKSVKYMYWPWEPALIWSNDVIIWSSYSYQTGHLAGLFFYDRNEDLLQIRSISERAFNESSQKYGYNRTVYPHRCRRRSF